MTNRTQIDSDKLGLELCKIIKNSKNFLNKKSLEEIKLLLQKGANANIQNNLGWTPLMLAAKNGQTEIAKILIAAGANVNWEKDGWSVIIIGASNGDSEFVKTLIAAGANVDVKSSFGWTAIMSAAGNADPEVLQIIIAAGANLNTQAEDGINALINSVITAKPKP